ncbi:MAG: cobalamin B12-binding domain-containing protein [Candidatus Bathyarchaeota archaeon]|nr:cobalamin B12-binding domain-containing protein [Candidatus Bathyarchaeota archaeon]
MKVLFIEPPKYVWFVMGEYLPPPYGILQLAAYLEREVNNVEIKVIDCNAQQLDWKDMEQQIESFNPDIVACSALATCNTCVVLRTLETVKRVNPQILTVAGGQHFTATAQASLETYPEIDVIVRGEGEITFTDLVNHVNSGFPFSSIQGISFKHNGEISHNPPRPLLKDLNDLPYPGYHLRARAIKKGS